MSQPLTIADVSSLLDLMSRHAVTQLSFQGLTVTRIPEMQSHAKAATPDREAEWRALEKMPPDTIDAALMLRRTRGGA